MHIFLNFYHIIYVGINSKILLLKIPNQIWTTEEYPETWKNMDDLPSDEDSNIDDEIDNDAIAIVNQRNEMILEANGEDLASDVDSEEEICLAQVIHVSPPHIPVPNQPIERVLSKWNKKSHRHQ